MEAFKMESIYIVIKDMTVINANLSSSYMTADLSQNAYLGFSHNLARYLDEKIPQEEDDFGEINDVQLGHEKAFAILKHVEFNQGHASFTGHLNDNNHKALNIPMNPPEIKGTLKQTLVMQLFIRDYHQDLKDWVQQFLFFHRFSGGDIQHPHYLVSEIIRDNEDLEKSLQYEKGWIVKDATHQFVEKAKQSDYETAFCDFLSIFKKVEKGKTTKEDKITYKRHHKGWFYASLAGYQLLEPPKTRAGARFSYLHAFAEPIITLHKLEYFRKKMILSLFWYSEFNNNTYRLKQGD
jgi:hypothetical protein